MSKVTARAANVTVVHVEAKVGAINSIAGKTTIKDEDQRSLVARGNEDTQCLQTWRVRAVPS